MKKNKRNKRKGLIALENELMNWHTVKEYIFLAIVLGMILHAIDSIIWPDISLFG